MKKKIKFVALISYKATYTAPDFARMFYDYIVCKFGMPKKIVKWIIGFCQRSGRPSYTSFSVFWQCQVVITLRQMVHYSAFIIILNRYSIAM